MTNYNIQNSPLLTKANPVWQPEQFGKSPCSCLVLGDGMEDLYLRAMGRKPNPENPCLAAMHGNTYNLPGGAMNVVDNIAGFGLTTFCVCPTMQTKYRVLDESDKLVVRFDGEVAQNKTINMAWLREWLLADGNHCPTLVIADYAKGSITSELIEMLAAMSPLVFSSVWIDTKRSPQEFVALSEAFGNSCTFLPNKQEYSMYSTLYNALPSVVRTESEDGVSYVNYGHQVLHVPATNNKVVNVCGAGDTVTAAVAASRANGLSWEQSLNVAMRAAGYVVGKPMTSSVPNGHLLIDYYQKINDRM